MYAHENSSQFSVVSSQSKPAVQAVSQMALPVPPLRTENRELKTTSLPRYRDRRRYNVCQRQRQQKFPPKRHQLIVAEARQRAAHPYIKEEKGDHFGREPEHRQQRRQNPAAVNRPMPSAKEQEGGQTGHGNHV